MIYIHSIDTFIHLFAFIIYLFFMRIFFYRSPLGTMRTWKNDNARNWILPTIT